MKKQVLQPTEPERGGELATAVGAPRWTGCYDSSWKGLIVPEAFAHPAKFARGLIQRIYQHLMQSHGLKPGMTVVDPFGGVALGGLDAMLAGLHWVGCELEPKFVALGNQNIAEWQQRIGHACTGSARLVQGDSRKLASIIAAVDGLVSSPPYNLPMSQDHNGTRGGKRGIDPSETGAFVRYGQTPGQLGGMREGDVEAVVSSPPYEEGGWHGGGTNGRGDGKPIDRNLQGMLDGYGESEGQIGGCAGETFWQASKQIVQQCHAILRPQGLAVWVCKDFVRNKQRVPFSDDWRKLCEACGFELVEWIQASLVRESVAATMFDGPVTRRKERKSFFRRLAEKKGSPRIDHEDVLVMRKRGGHGGAAEAVVSSPPFQGAHDGAFDGDSLRPPHDSTDRIQAGYGATAGQLAALPAGTVAEAIAEPSDHDR